mmetsp:Transcript_34394/g.78386  ORF Transcript_34394/g.78386 Transcript_34394/m.78386 type:complete len:125 (-) Transcript_34394:400-774(-)
MGAGAGTFTSATGEGGAGCTSAGGAAATAEGIECETGVAGKLTGTGGGSCTVGMRDDGSMKEPPLHATILGLSSGSSLTIVAAATEAIKLHVLNCSRCSVTFTGASFVEEDSTGYLGITHDWDL